MPLELEMFAVMEFLWENSEKTHDGKNISYTTMDIDTLWYLGFVDTKKYPLEKWKEAFEPYRQSDQTFLLSKGAYLSLDKYRYRGEIHVPFDAMKINEGLYTDEGLNDLIEASIEPSCLMPEKDFKNFFDEIKKEFRTPDGLIRIKREAKLKIKELIDKNPSPLRNLELLFDRMIASGEKQELEKKIEGSQVDVVTARAAIEASSFSEIPTSMAEASAVKLKKIEKPKAKSKAPEAKTPAVELKKITRSRKGMRG